MLEYFLNNILVWTRYNPTLALVLCKTSKVVPFTVAGPRRQTSLREFSPISPLVLDIPFSATMANFGDLKSDGGLNKLNGFLSSKSYIEG